MAVDAATLELRALAEQRHRDPAAVRDRAAALLDDADLPPAAMPVGEWVLGLALHELGEPGPAADHLRRAARQARRGGDAGGAGANPVYASPVYASPVYASPVYASPVYASPVYASPDYASPVYASPVYA